MKAQVKGVLVGALLAGGLMTALPAAAQTCGVSGASSTSLGNYDPFNPVAISNASVQLNLTRFAQAQKKTQQIDFYFTKPAGSPAYQITYNGQNVLFEAPGYAGAPTLVANNEPPGSININFGGTSQPDTVSRNFVVTIPPGVDLSAGDPIQFDIRYVCQGTGGMQSVNSPQIIPNAITLQINVLSALQASYVGSALDFGEIGDKSTTTVQASPSTYTKTGAIRVASSGPYTVAMTSQNNYKLTAPGASTINYSADFLGQIRNSSTGAFTTTTCVRAGIAGQNLPISATLLEGGQTKIPAPNYADLLTVTVTPLATAVAPQACASL